MQYKQTLVVLLTLCVPVLLFSQSTTYLPQGARENILLERLEIKAGRDSILNFSKTKPFSRRQFMPVIEQYYRAASPVSGPPELPMTLDTVIFNRQQHPVRLTDVDLYNAQLALQKNNEFSSIKFQSKKPFLKRFYQTPANFYEVNTKDFFLAVNPVFQYVVGKERNSNEHLFLNTRGVSLRGMIASKVGFTAFITENQERDPQYVQQWVTERQAVPGAGYYKNFKGTGYDYFDARGTITFNAAKYIDISFGYDKNFIGNGYRSLFLSDFSNNALFLRLNTRIWKLNYQNLFMELVNAHGRGGDVLLGKKYAAIHHLDIGVTKWLNIGLFEAIVFGRENRFEFGYLNPVIFYRAIEQQNGSADNAMTGMDFKANVAKKFQFYGQLLLDELKISELSKSWWANKFGLQLGGKYIDAFGVQNLDLQAEFNRVRPFTYSHYDSVANFTHDNQPLAHPLGASFNEVIGQVRYQFAPRWMFQAMAVAYKQGRDTSAESFGSNIFLPNRLGLRRAEYGYSIGLPVATNVRYASLLLSYELKPNLFLEANAVFRKQGAYATVPERMTAVIYAGIRWNMHRREFVF
ncbi:MAG TPA: hypothetical protein VGN63_11455 [Flavisolibacter sp.]|jgi:hypothetical protein|nr:hypothetical protein [Flavisolibacter sp.]